MVIPGFPKWKCPKWKCLLVAVMASMGAGCEMFSVFSSPAQERGVKGFFSDNCLRISLNAAFLSSGVCGMEQVEFLIHDGRVLLMGVVDSATIGKKALALAKGLYGVKEVIDEMVVGRESFSDYSHDLVMGYKVRAFLFGDVGILSRNYHTRVSRGVVYVLGTAQSQKEKEQVIRQLEEISGVRNIVPHIAVKKPSP